MNEADSRYSNRRVRRARSDDSDLPAIGEEGIGLN